MVVTLPPVPFGEIDRLKSKLDQLKRQLSYDTAKNTSVISGFVLMKAVNNKTLISILKSDGILSAEEALLRNPDDIFASNQAKLNEIHPALKNVIYAAAIRKGYSEETGSSQPFEALKNHGNVSIKLKDSVLNKPGTTYTYYDTGYEILTGRFEERVKFFKAELLTSSELIQGELTRDTFSEIDRGKFFYSEVQIKSKISLAEIEEIEFHEELPIREERELAASAGIPIRYRGIILAANLSMKSQLAGYNNLPEIPLDDTALPLPNVTSPLIEPTTLPDFQELPKALPPKKLVPIEPSDSPPIGRIANYKDFKSIQDVQEWCYQGKDIEVDFTIHKLDPTTKFAIKQGGGGVWLLGVRYTAADF